MGRPVLISGALQGLLSELVFSPSATQLGRGGSPRGSGRRISAIRALTYHVTWPLSYQVVYGVLVLISAGLIAGAGSRVLTTRLAAAGALSPFASARG